MTAEKAMEILRTAVYDAADIRVTFTLAGQWLIRVKMPQRGGKELHCSASDLQDCIALIIRTTFQYRTGESLPNPLDNT